MTPEQLAELWQNELSKDVRYKTWQQFTCDEVDARVRVATTILEKLAYERYMNTQLEGDLREQIFKALGEASMCWSETPQGTFDDQRAREIGERLVQQIESKHINHVLDQYAVAQSIARMEKQISRLNTEIFSTRITKHSDKLDQGTVRRQTLLGRVDELSSMAALGPVDQSFFLE
jgi:hypothetical protein